MVGLLQKMGEIAQRKEKYDIHFSRIGILSEKVYTWPFLWKLLLKLAVKQYKSISISNVNLRASKEAILV